MPSIDKEATQAGITQNQTTADAIRKQADADYAHMMSVAGGWGHLYWDAQQAITHATEGLAVARRDAHYRLAAAHDGIATKDGNTIQMFDNTDEVHSNQLAQITNGTTSPDMPA